MKKTLLTILAAAGFLLLHAQEPKTDSLQEYTGKYKFPAGGPVAEITVVIDNGVLYANSDIGNSELKKTEGDIFYVVAYDGTATFKRSVEGKINGVKIEVDDLIMEGTKSETPALLPAEWKSIKRDSLFGS